MSVFTNQNKYYHKWKDVTRKVIVVMLPGIKTDNKIHKCPFIWLSTRIFTVTNRRNTRTDRPNSPRGRNLVPRFLRHFYNVTHSPTLKMSSETFDTAMFSGVLNSYKGMPHYNILTLIAFLPCIIWVDQAQCQQLLTNKT